MPYLSPPTLTRAEQAALLRVSGVQPRDQVIFSLALGTGLRLSEFVGLNVGDVFTGDGTPRSRIRLRKEIAKGGRAGDVFLPDAVGPKLRPFRSGPKSKVPLLSVADLSRPDLEPHLLSLPTRRRHVIDIERQNEPVVPNGNIHLRGSLLQEHHPTKVVLDVFEVASGKNKMAHTLLHRSIAFMQLSEQHLHPSPCRSVYGDRRIASGAAVDLHVVQGNQDALITEDVAVSPDPKKELEVLSRAHIRADGNPCLAIAIEALKGRAHTRQTKCSGHIRGGCDRQPSNHVCDVVLA
jgi:hypothetical protein